MCLKMLEFAIRALRPLRFRGKHRLLSRFVPIEGVRVADVFGYSMQLDLSDWIQRNIYLGSYERIEAEWVRRYLRPGMTVVDVGANVGFYTALAARCVGLTGRVFAIEPSALAFGWLRRTTDANPMPQVTLCNLGLADEAGEQLLYGTPGFTGNHTPTMVPHGIAFEKVAVTTLDRFMTEQKIDTVDLLKLDIQGFEPKVLRGAQAALESRRIRAVLCEFEGYWLDKVGSSIEDLWATLAHYGFRPSPEITLDEMIQSRLATRLLIAR